MKQIKSLVPVGIILVALLVIAPTYAAPHQTITVTTTNDELNTDGDCSLREAIRAANLDQAVSGCTAGNLSDEIVLQANATYTLTIAGQSEDAAATGDLDFTSNVLITGNGATIQAGTTTANGIDRVLDVRVGGVLTVSDAIIQHGRTQGGGGINVQGDLLLIDSTVTGNTSTTSGGGIGSSGTGSSVTVNNSTISQNVALVFGGGLSAQGDLTITGSLITGNQAKSNGGGILFTGTLLQITNSTISSNVSDSDANGSGDGGGIHSKGTMSMTNSTVAGNSANDSGGIYNTGATATIVRSTISGNTGKSVGGIRNQDDGTLRMTNSTVSGNQANPGSAGGIANSVGSGTAANTKTELFNVTIANNTAGFNGGGIANSGTFELRNSIIANNTAPSTKDCSGTLSSFGYNLIENTTGCTITGTTTGNKTGQDPALGSLATNSGDTKTHALNSGSPAIDAGNPAGCLDQGGTELLVDQRDFARSVDGDGNGSKVCDMGAYERLSPGTLTPTPTTTSTATRTPTNTRTPTRTPTPSGMLNFVGTVWDDLDRDGVKEAGEPGLPNVTVEVWNAAKTQQHDTGLTNSSGQYSVFGPPGGLRVRVILPAGYTFSPFGTGAGTTSNDIHPNGEDFGFSNVSTQAGGGLIKNAGMYTGATPTPSVTATGTATATATGTPTFTDIPFQTQTPTATATATQNPGSSTTPTRTRTQTPTPTTQVGCTAKPAKPTLKAPPDNVTLANRSPKLKWNAAACAVTYTVLVKNFETNQKAYKKTGLTKLQRKTNELAPTTRFKWIVKACNAFGCTKSAKRTFTTAP